MTACNNSLNKVPNLTPIPTPRSPDKLPNKDFSVKITGTNASPSTVNGRNLLKQFRQQQGKFPKFNQNISYAALNSIKTLPFNLYKRVTA